MRANSPSAITTSLLLHAFVAALIFVTTIYVAQQNKPPVVFELVAGPPDGQQHLFAPALGNTEAPVKLEVPKVELPPAKVEPVAPPEPKVQEAVPPKATPAKPDTSIVKEMKKNQRVSYQDYLKKHPTPKPAPVTTQRPAANVPRIDAQGIAKGVRGGSTASKAGEGGTALTREEHDALDTYISFLKVAVKEAHEPPPGVSDQLEVKIAFEITAGGSILNPRVVKSSGNREFDRSALEAFRRARPIGPTPTGQSYSWTLTFQMKDEG